MRAFPAVLSLALGVTLASSAQAQARMALGPNDGRDLPPTDIERVAVGAPAPDFTLTKMGGGSVTLSSFRGKKNVVLVFYRGFWCPYCIKQLAGMRQLLDSDMKKDTELLAVSVDDSTGTRKTITRISADGVEPDFAFLSDPDHAVIARYGILNPNGGDRGIPHPATYVIDRTGVVRWKDIETDYKIRPANEAIVTAVRALPRGRR
jgi:peroxiredoxin